MRPITADLYKKIVIVSDEVKKQLRRKGMVIPVEHSDGSIEIGSYKIVKNNNFYSILDYSGEVVVDKINLPQSAILIANNLALGRCIDDRILALDRSYGYALFEEILHGNAVKKSTKKPLDYFDLMVTKRAIAKSKKESYKNTIVASFEKLRKVL